MTGCTPERIAARARATYTRAEIIETRPHYTTFFAVYTTPEGDVADRIYCYSDMLAGDRVPPGQTGHAERVRKRRMNELRAHLHGMLGDTRG